MIDANFEAFQAVDNGSYESDVKGDVPVIFLGYFWGQEDMMDQYMTSLAVSTLLEGAMLLAGLFCNFCGM